QSNRSGPGASLALLVCRNRLVGLAALDVLAVLGVGRIAVGEAMLVAMLGDVLQAPLGLLEALGLALTSLFERLAGRILAELRHLAADPRGFRAGSLRLGVVLRRVGALGACNPGGLSACLF